MFFVIFVISHLDLLSNFVSLSQQHGFLFERLEVRVAYDGRFLYTALLIALVLLVKHRYYWFSLRLKTLINLRWLIECEPFRRSARSMHDTLSWSLYSGSPFCICLITFQWFLSTFFLDLQFNYKANYISRRSSGTWNVILCKKLYCRGPLKRRLFNKLDKNSKEKRKRGGNILSIKRSNSFGRNNVVFTRLIMNSVVDDEELALHQLNSGRPPTARFFVATAFIEHFTIIARLQLAIRGWRRRHSRLSISVPHYFRS